MSHLQLLQQLRERQQSHVVLLTDTPAIEQTILLAEAIQREVGIAPLVFAESDSVFKQRTRPSTIVVHGVPAGVIATFTVLDQQGIPARLCSPLDLPGCHDGSCVDLANAWLSTLQAEFLNKVLLVAMGSGNLSQQSQQLAIEFGIQCHVAKSE